MFGLLVKLKWNAASCSTAAVIFHSERYCRMIFQVTRLTASINVLHLCNVVYTPSSITLSADSDQSAAVYSLSREQTTVRFVRQPVWDPPFFLHVWSLKSMRWNEPAVHGKQWILIFFLSLLTLRTRLAPYHFHVQSISHLTLLSASFIRLHPLPSDQTGQWRFRCDGCPVFCLLHVCS